MPEGRETLENISGRRKAKRERKTIGEGGSMKRMEGESRVRMGCSREYHNLIILTYQGVGGAVSGFRGVEKSF